MVKGKGGRPRTGRNTSVTVRISDEAKGVLDGVANKTELIDALISGKEAILRCPKCGGIITINTED